VRCLLLPCCLFASAAMGASYNIRDFGATGDGATKDTVAVQKALDACAVHGGGDVIVPAGRYLIGSVQIGTQTVLHLEKDAILAGTPDLADYPLVDIRWEGRWQPGNRGLIYAANVDHTAIVGPGRIEGNPAVAFGRGEKRGAVVLEAVSCQDLRWEGFTVTQGGTWATHPTYCTDVVIQGVTITSGRDGIDIDSCRNVRIDGCTIDSGDDSISLKSGRGLNGARIGRPTEDVVITHCTLRGRTFACVGIGSETSGGIRNVRIEHTRFTHSGTHAIYIKTRIGRAGTIENISGDDLDVEDGGFLRINLTVGGNQSTPDDNVDGDIGYPVGRNYAFTNIRLHGKALVDATQVAAEKPLEGLVLAHLSGTCTSGIKIANTRGVELRDINVTGFTGPLLATDHVTGTGLEGAVPYEPPAKK